MFSFFKKKGPQVSDVIFLNEQGYASAINEWLQQNPDGIVATWFQQDLEQLRQKLAGVAESRFVLADRLAFSHDVAKPLLFAGHYPLRATEQELFESKELNDVLIYSHLDLPLMKLFGADRIKELMIKMGMKEDEPLTHNMIATAIANAQDKIAKTVITDMRARSEEEWMRMNTAEKM